MIFITQVNIHEAKTRFSRLIAIANEGEEIIIAKAGEPVARLTRIGKPVRKRFPGSAKGKLRISDDFNAPLPKSILKDFEG